MKIDTSKPRLPIDRTERFKFPIKPIVKQSEEPEDLRLEGKEGEELERIVKKLYNMKINTSR